MKLTATDRKVLAGMSAHPEFSGKELSDVLGLRVSSLMKSRKRLTDSGILRIIRVPSFQKLGLSVTFSGFGAIKRGVRIEEGRKMRIPQTFFLAGERDKGFGIGAVPSYTDFYRLFIGFRRKSIWIEPESFGFSLFPTELTDFLRFGDYGPLISQEFGMDPGDEPDNGFMKGEPLELKENDLEIYRHLIGHPDWTGEKIAITSGTSRQRVHRLKRDFEELGLYREKAVLNLKKLGYEVLLFVLWKMSPETYGKLREVVRRKRIAPAIAFLMTPIEGMMVAAFKTFRESRETYERITGIIRTGRNINEPHILHLSMQDTDFPEYFDFSGVLGAPSSR